MENFNLARSVSNMNLLVHSGKPTIPSGKQPVVERKFADPSSCFPKGERYPIPAFFEYRASVKDHDSL